MKPQYLLITVPCIMLLSGKPQIQSPEPADWLTMPTDTVSISIIGDVMMHARQLEYDYTGFLHNIETSLKEADIAIANMEFSLAGSPHTGYPAFSAPDGYAAYVRDCGVDVFLTANNHIMDKGRNGAIRTMEVYDTTAGIRWTGAYRSPAEKESRNPLFIKCKGIKFALLNFSYGSNGPVWKDAGILLMDKNEIHEAVVRAKAQRADFIIALPHWGTEYRTRHDKTQQEWAEWLVSEGVDAIAGCHPHVVQDTCRIGDVPVIYSLGNAISNMSAPNTQLGYMATLRFTNDWQNGEKRILEPELRYIWCSLPGGFSGNYSTIFTDEWLDRPECWSGKSDYEKMRRSLPLSPCR